MEIPASFIIVLSFTLWNGENTAAEVSNNLTEQIMANITAMNNDLLSRNISDSKICYDNLGCFYKRRFRSYMAGFPPDPSKQTTEFWLFTKPNQTNFQKLYYNNPDSIKASSYNPKCSTKFLVHGYSNTGNYTWVKNATEALLIVETCVNVIVVNWENASNFNYIAVSIRAELIGRQMAVLCYHLKQYGANVSEIHLIGNSMGAQITGFAGQFFKERHEETLGRISGVDPAGPLFCKMFPFLAAGYHLNRSHAQFVDILHTNTIGFGCRQEIGHVDFYPNGGSMQPGCIFQNFTNIWCSHQMSQYYYVHSIYKTPCHFHSFPANNQSHHKFLAGKAFNCRNGCGCMGYRSPSCPGRGKQYLSTLENYPFCGSHFKVSPSAFVAAFTVKLSDGTVSTSTLTITRLIVSTRIVAVSEYVNLDLTKNLTATTSITGTNLPLISVYPLSVTNETGYTTIVNHSEN